MNKWLLGAALIIAIIAVYYVVGDQLLKRQMTLTQGQAVAFATQELNYRYPGAAIEVFDVKNTSTVAGENSWLVRANVAYGKNTLCPNLTVVDVDQKFNFVPREKDMITENCRVRGCLGIAQCSVNYPEEAILLPLDTSHNPYLPLQAAISGFKTEAGGASNVQASATRYADKYTSSYTNVTYTDVWLVSYSFESAPSSLDMILNKSTGVVLEFYRRLL